MGTTTGKGTTPCPRDCGRERGSGTDSRRRGCTTSTRSRAGLSTPVKSKSRPGSRSVTCRTHRGGRRGLTTLGRPGRPLRLGTQRSDGKEVGARERSVAAREGEKTPFHPARAEPSVETQHPRQWMDRTGTGRGPWDASQGGVAGQGPEGDHGT